MEKTYLLLRAVIVIVACTGFLFQIIHVSTQYFAYLTTIRVQQIRSPEILPLTVCFCVPYADVLTDTRSNKQDPVTVAQILTMTPVFSEIISSCRYRNDVRLINAGKSECYNQHTMTAKIYTQDAICYLIDPKSRKPLMKELIAHAVGVANAFIVSEFQLSQVFDNVTRMQALAYDGGLPYISRDYAPVVSMRSVNKHGTEMQISPSFSFITKLPVPYQNGCRPLARSLSKTYYACTEACLVAGLRNFSRVPFSTLIFHPYEKPHVSEQDLENESIASTISSLDKKCNKACNNNIASCKFSFTFTKVTAIDRRERGISITLQTPFTADTFSEAIPAMTFVEFFSFIISCFGGWFGVSFLSIDLKKLLLGIRHVRATQLIGRVTKRRRNRRRKHERPFFAPDSRNDRSLASNSQC